MLTPRTARYLLVGVVAACISATAAVAVRDATRPVAQADQVAHPLGGFQIPGSSTDNLPIVIIGSGQATASGGRISLLPDTLPGGAVAVPTRVPVG